MDLCRTFADIKNPVRHFELDDLASPKAFIPDLLIKIIPDNKGHQKKSCKSDQKTFHYLNLSGPAFTELKKYCINHPLTDN